MIKMPIKEEPKKAAHNNLRSPLKGLLDSLSNFVLSSGSKFSEEPEFLVKRSKSKKAMLSSF